MFKQLMSDFAFNRTIQKTRKLSKQNASAVVASLLETQAKKYFVGYKASVIDNLLKEVVNSITKEIRQSNMPGSDGDLTFETVCLSAVACHAIIEQDVSEDFVETNTVSNQVKILVNLKLLPENFLSFDFSEEESVA
jgi:hypothetical protein